MRSLVFLLVTILIAVSSTAPLGAATPCTPAVAQAVSVQGRVEVRRAGSVQWEPVGLNDRFCPGDQLQVLERSRADVALATQPVLRLDQNTTITFAGASDRGASLIDLLNGALHFLSRSPRSLDVRTTFVNAGVEGTEALVRVEADRAVVTVFEGRVLAANPVGSLVLADGESAVAETGRAPIARAVVRPRDAVEWALYYRPVLYFRPGASPAAGAWEQSARKSNEAFRRGDIQGAFESLRGLPAGVSDPDVLAYRASLLLAVGQVDAARTDLDRALSADPGHTDALALQAVVAVTQNDKEEALALGQKAVESNPNSASAYMALSFARQIRFDAGGARSALERAVQADPGNALAWARLAELHLSFADLDAALSSAERAIAIDPGLSRTQTVLGYAYLARVDTRNARAAFEKAIVLDHADYLPRLGLGLAKIRDGDLEEGRREIEVAASLDPNNSLVRSYLGKAYFEEKRSPLDEREYATAKELDPRDPTPFFYHAIQKQTTNRPVEALEDLERAIELNDNRAVYRSRFLLESDLAARSASLARIYSDLGFQQLALVEGWKSVNTDPTNFSAHRFLADTYSVLPRHEIARVSELLQSQLLQPLNMTPIQPRLAESNLFLVSALGPQTLSFNEFHPLFNRDGVNFQTTGLAGENSTYAGEGVLSGIYKKAAFSLGGFHFRTDGWRTNADQKDTIANAFLQVELTPQTSVQAEVRRRETEFGDLQQQFFFETFSPALRDVRKAWSLRLGGRHSFSPGSIVLGSFVFQDRSGMQSEPGFLDSRPENSRGGEFQHLLRRGKLTVTSGGGYFDVNSKPTTRIGSSSERSSSNLDHFNVYAYANVGLLENLILTGGATFENLSGSRMAIRNGRQEQISPKLGISWSPWKGTWLRAAATRTLKRRLINDATLEPTQVAGFNQFFDGINGTRAWRYGAAIDQTLGRNLFGGIELSMRDLKIPVITGPSSTRTEHGREYLARTYLFWAPHRWVALRSEYIFERFDNAILPIDRVSTHRVPLGINVFHPSGLSLSGTATYHHQAGKFLRVPFFESASSNFWTVDAALSYRLPRRFGIVSVGAANLFDKKFRYFDTDRNNPRLQPDRTIFARATLALP